MSQMPAWGCLEFLQGYWVVIADCSNPPYQLPHLPIGLCMLAPLFSCLSVASDPAEHGLAQQQAPSLAARCNIGTDEHGTAGQHTAAHLLHKGCGSPALGGLHHLQQHTR
eukprot:GHUV01053721.1.p1 GENE.GHUV01053721.1~~GHUV01053721.1.p1  ORF type:complete len:110 (+),score=28.22 GHUV01053721.1:428-757(+)